MIKFQELTPYIYNNESRDFQLIGRLFDLLFNSAKTEAETLYNLPVSVNSDEQLLELLAFTLGLKLKTTSYTSKHLRALCSVFPELLRNKGTYYAINLLCVTLLRVEGLEDDPILLFEGSDKLNLRIYLPQQFRYPELIDNIMPYIMPAGMSYSLIRASFIKLDEDDTRVTIPIGFDVTYTTGVILKSDLYNPVNGAQYKPKQKTTSSSAVDSSNLDPDLIPVLVPKAFIKGKDGNKTSLVAQSGHIAATRVYRPVEKEKKYSL